MLTTKIASQNANLSPIPPHQNGIPLLPGIFGTPDDYQYAVSSGENSRAVGTSPECYEVPNPQQFSPTNSHLASTHQAFDPSLMIQYGFHTPSVYNDQFGTQSPNVPRAPMGPFMNQ
uniref:Uncharacterized protein n=1 Tax=Romanomermis culicivorax TaxID=13658 RepID=A0A915I188_ROMCU